EERGPGLRALGPRRLAGTARHPPGDRRLPGAGHPRIRRPLRPAAAGARPGGAGTGDAVRARPGGDCGGKPMRRWILRIVVLLLVLVLAAAAVLVIDVRHQLPNSSIPRLPGHSTP